MHLEVPPNGPLAPGGGGGVAAHRRCKSPEQRAHLTAPGQALGDDAARQFGLGWFHGRDGAPSRAAESRVEARDGGRQHRPREYGDGGRRRQPTDAADKRRRPPGQPAALPRRQAEDDEDCELRQEPEVDDQGLQGVHQKRERDREAERRDQVGGDQQVAQARRPRPGPRACRTASPRSTR